MQRRPGYVENGRGEGIVPDEEALHRIVEPSHRQPAFGADVRRCLVDRQPGLEDGIDIAGGAPRGERKGDRRTADHVHVAEHSLLVKPPSQCREGADDVVPVHRSATLERAT